MKQSKLISLDEDIIERLKEEDNASKLVNDLLLDYYGENKSFKKIRILNRLKLLKQHEKELAIEKARIEEEVKGFMETKPKPEIVEVNKVKTVTHQGQFAKEEMRENNEQH